MKRSLIAVTAALIALGCPPGGATAQDTPGGTIQIAKGGGRGGGHGGQHGRHHDDDLIREDRHRSGDDHGHHSDDEHRHRSRHGDDELDDHGRHREGEIEEHGRHGAGELEPGDDGHRRRGRR